MLSVCTLMLPAVMMWWLRVHLRENERDRPQAVRRQTEVLALRAGETFVGVIEDDEGYCTFIVHDTTQSWRCSRNRSGGSRQTSKRSIRCQIVGRFKPRHFGTASTTQKPCGPLGIASRAKRTPHVPVMRLSNY